MLFTTGIVDIGTVTMIRTIVGTMVKIQHIFEKTVQSSVKGSPPKTLVYYFQTHLNWLSNTV